MRHRSRFGLPASLFSAAGLALAVFSGSNAYSQACPVTPNCNPTQSADFDNNTVFESGIRTVIIGTMTNTTPANSPGGTSNGYTDYSCQGGALLKGVTITANQNVPVTVLTGVNVAENVRIYLDMNNDGVFNIANEQVFTSSSAINHTGSINIPATAVLNTALRLRVVSEYTLATALPSPCKALEYGQAEDYYVIVTQNTSPPQADFITNETVTCDGSVCFTDLSQNSPVTWAWTFGDGGTSNQQNPCHTYTTAGQYTVKLTVTNANGTDIETKTNYITYNSNVPVTASCTPTTQNFCCDYGIGNVIFGNINHTSGTAVEGYQDNTCSDFTNITEGISTSISINTTGALAHDVTVWLDLNNNGVFTANEQIFSAVNVTDPSGSISIPAGALTNTPLRLRVMAEATGLPFSACTNLNRGQAEDYTVIIKPNLGIPITSFTTQNFSSCNEVVTFVNQTTNTSAASTQYTWNFGDGFTQTVTGNSNVTHTYPSSNGTYTVKLKACNANGCDSLTKVNYIKLTPGVAFCDTVNMPTSGTVTMTSCTGVIYDNGGPNANYSNNTNGYLTISPIGAGSVTVTVNTFVFENAFDVLYIYDGPNSSSPLLAALTGANINLPQSFTSSGSVLTLRQVTDQVQNQAGFSATWQCTQASSPPIANFTADFAQLCTGLVSFTNQTIGGATSYTWNFGDGSPNVTTANPTHTYQTATPAAYDITLIACNAFGCDTIVKPAFVNITVPCISYCASSGHNNTNQYIRVVSIGGTTGINNTTGAEPNGYGNYTAQSDTVTLNATVPYSVLLGSNFQRTLSIWIDWNKNGTFETTEQVVTNQQMSQQAGGTGYSGNITVPGTAQLGSTRMRIIARQSGLGNNDPCVMNSQAAEVEDYTIVVEGNNQPVVANFIANPATTCNGTVSFTDLSTNGATSWNWNFGDNTATSTVQNPVHTYAAVGTYQVTLIGCNAIGCDTITKSVNYNPAATACDSIVMPVTGTLPVITRCTGRLYDNGGPNANYSNNSNSYVTIAPTGATSVTLTFQSFVVENNFDFVRIYDGASTASPQIANLSGTNLPASITSSGGAITIQFTSDQAQSAAGFTATWQCNQPNQAPIAQFNANLNNVCTGLVSFSDISANTPTSWSWNFGDGSPLITSQNPNHTYQTTTPAIYNVTLIACNAFGCDTIVKQNLVNITVPCNTYCSSTGHNNNQQFISQVTVGTAPNGINNPSGADPSGYGNYSAKSATVTKGSQVPYTVLLGSPFQRTLSIWVDWNQNGSLETTEQVVANQQMTQLGGGAGFTGSFMVPGTALSGTTRMRIFTRQSPQGNNDPCFNNSQAAEVEDYSLNVIVNTQPPIAAFTAGGTNACVNTPICFADQSTNVPTSWKWNFGDGSPLMTAQSPCHAYTALGTYTVTLIVSNAFGTDTLVRPNYITVANGVSVIPAFCTPSSSAPNSAYGIQNVTFNGINNTSGNATEGYKDFSCSVYDTLMVNQTYQLTVATYNLNQERTRAWIDWNNDGTFSASEQVMGVGSFNSPHIVNVLVPATATLNVFLRMRVSSDWGQSPAPTPCSSPVAGQIEDYAVMVSNGLSAADDQAAAQVQLFPNPSHGQFSLNLPTGKSAKVEVTNLIGATVHSQDIKLSTGTASVDMATAAPGVYLVKVTMGDSVVIKKLVIE